MHNVYIKSSLTNLIEIFCFQIEDNWPSIYKMAFVNGQTVYVHKLHGVKIKMPAIIHGNPWYSSGGIEMVIILSLPCFRALV